MTRFRLVAQPALLVLLTGTPVAAQITVGIRAGASMSEVVVTGLHIDDQAPRREYMLGASVGVPLSPHLGIEFGGSYIQRGSTSTLLQLGDVDLRIQYLRLTALARATAPLPGPLSLHVLGGAATAVETSCERDTMLALQPIVISIECDDPAGNAVTGLFDFGLVGGAGLRFAPAGRIVLSVDVLYSHGIGSFLEPDQDYTAENRAIELQAGIGFPIS